MPTSLKRFLARPPRVSLPARRPAFSNVERRFGFVDIRGYAYPAPVRSRPRVKTTRGTLPRQVHFGPLRTNMIAIGMGLGVLLGAWGWVRAGNDAQLVIASPRRIIAAAPSSAEIICALGACDRLVGVSRYVLYPPELRRLPKVGGIHDPDLEQILSLRPDLVILRGRDAHVVNLCRDNHIRLYEDRTDTLASLYTTIHELGGLLDRREPAQRLAANLREKLEAIGKTRAGKPRPKVLFTLRSPDKLASITTVAGDSYLNSLIALAGGKNIFGELNAPYPQVSLEEILARQPEVIIEAMPGETLDAPTRARLIGQWKNLGPTPAARAARIHFLTEDYVLTPSPRVVLLAERLREIFSDKEPAGGR